MTGEYRLYIELAGWWPLISPPERYAEEAAYQAGVLASATGPVRDVLDLGSGGGHVAVHLRDRFTLTLVDLSEDMLAVSQRLNPGCAHLPGDMRTVRLGRLFDAVLVHDAVDYVTCEADLRQVIGTAYAHCRPGGVAVFVPDHVADTFRATEGRGGGSDAAGRQASFREWTWDPDSADDWVRAEYEFVLRGADGSEQVIREVHRLGAFRRDAHRHQLRRPPSGTTVCGVLRLHVLRDDAPVGGHGPDQEWLPPAEQDFTDDGQVHEARGLKGRPRQASARRATRNVPIPPELVTPPGCR